MRPTNKVIAGVLAGAVTTIAVWASKAFGGIEIPIEVQGSLTVIFTAGVQYVVNDGAPSDAGDTEPQEHV